MPQRTVGKVLPVVAEVRYQARHLAVPIVVVVLIPQARLDLLRHRVDHLGDRHAAVLDLEAEEHVRGIRARRHADVELRPLNPHCPENTRLLVLVSAL